MTFLVKLIKFCLNVVYLFFKPLKTRKQITLISRQSNNITDDFRLLKEELEKQLPDYKIVVLCRKMDNKIKYCFHMLTQMYNISRSKIVILDSYCILACMLKHKKNLKVIQIWHALGLIKKAGYAILDLEEGRNKIISYAANMHRNYTHVFTSSKDCINSMSKVFDCDKNIIKSVPLPRIDLLKDKKINDNNKSKIYKKYPSLKKKINVVYAPTFRKNEDDMQTIINEMCEKFDYKKYNLIIKLHPLSKIVIDNKNAIIDKKFSTLEMLSISDYVISDYSSIIYEAGIMNKKLIFFAFDLDSYKGKRDFFIDYVNEVPGPVCKNANEILEFLNNPDYKKYKDRDMISKYVDLEIDNYSKNMVNEIIKLLS